MKVRRRWMDSAIGLDSIIVVAVSVVIATCFFLRCPTRNDVIDAAATATFTIVRGCAGWS